MKAYCLASSSLGNCFIFELEIRGVPHNIMIECGIPLSDIYKKCVELNIKMSSIDACLITHIHSDHSKSARELSRLNIPIFASKETLEGLNLKERIIYPNTPNEVLNGLYVYPFTVDHDVDGAYGFLIKTAKDVLIMGHNDMDMDALGAALGVKAICDRFEKSARIGRCYR